jgi:prolyl oligopeptidase
VYGTSKSGSDWEEYGVLDLATRKPLADKLEWVKVSNVAWRGDGFFYSRYPAPDAGKELSSSNANHRVFFHRLGTPQSADELIFEDAGNPQRFHILHTTEDERFAILEVHDRGTGKQGNALFVRDLSRPSSKFTPLVPEITDDTFEVIDSVGDSILVATDRKAANRRVVAIDPRHPSESSWKTVLPESSEPLESIDTAGGKLFATSMKDVTTRWTAGSSTR